MSMYASASTSASRHRASSIHTQYRHELKFPTMPVSHPPDYMPYLPPPTPTYRSRNRRWPSWFPSLSWFWSWTWVSSSYRFFWRSCHFHTALPFRRSPTRMLALLSGFLAFMVVCVFALYEPYIELVFYSRSWIRAEIDPVPPLAGCFGPARVSPRYNLSEALHGRRHTEVQAGLPMRLGMDCYHFAGTVRADVSGWVGAGAGEATGDRERTQFHTYWRVDLVPFGVRQEWMIKSFFATQDLRSSQLVVWSNGDLSTNEILRGYLERYPEAFAIRIVDIPSLAKGTALSGSELLKLKDQKAWLDGDLLRLLLLWNFGGVWVDMDSLLTRDLAPLLEHEFVTQWDCYDKRYQALNGALIRFRQHSPYLCEAFHIIASSSRPRKHSTDWGAILYLKLHRRLLAASIPPFKILPFCFSDGRSCRLDNRLPDPFAPDSRSLGGTWATMEEGGALDQVLGKVFGVHLHNQWEKGFPLGGWVDRLLLRRYDERLKIMGLEAGSSGAQIGEEEGWERRGRG